MGGRSKPGEGCPQPGTEVGKPSVIDEEDVHAPFHRFLCSLLLGGQGNTQQRELREHRGLKQVCKVLKVTARLGEGFTQAPMDLSPWDFAEDKEAQLRGLIFIWQCPEDLVQNGHARYSIFTSTWE